MYKIYNHTHGLCPECGKKTIARIIEKESKVYLQKFCQAHGFSEALISSDAEWYAESVRYVKPKQDPLDIGTKEFKGCPDSCGSCPEHQQHTCLPVIEIAEACNLDCPICLKSLDSNIKLTGAEFRNIIDELLRREGRVDVVNISGGEPTLHPELEDFLRYAKTKGVMQTTVSTNGLTFLSNSALIEIFRSTGALAAIQFDGFESSTYERLRGANLAAKKLEVIELLERENIRYSLVATIAKGINDKEIPRIADFFFSSKAVSLMLQPLALTGAGKRFSLNEKLTIPDVVHSLEKSRHIKKGDFNPLPCSHYSCFALAYYFILGEDRYLNLKEFLGADDYLNTIANKTLPGLDTNGFDLIKRKLYDVWSLADAGSLGEQALKRIQSVIRDVSANKQSPEKLFAHGVASMKAIFIHEFMDKHTFDFARLIKCCNPYPRRDGRFIPICTQNVILQEV